MIRAAGVPSSTVGPAMVPVNNGIPVAAIGVYWRTVHHATEAELKSLAMVATLAAAVFRVAPVKVASAQLVTP